jgi:hypothetical protein
MRGVLNKLPKRVRRRVLRVAQRRTHRVQWAWGSRARRLMGRNRKKMDSHDFYCPELGMKITIMVPKSPQ